MGYEPWAVGFNRCASHSIMFIIARLCKRTGALGVKRREATVRRHAKLARRRRRHKIKSSPNGDTLHSYLNSHLSYLSSKKAAAKISPRPILPLIYCFSTCFLISAKEISSSSALSDSFSDFGASSARSVSVSFTDSSETSSLSSFGASVSSGFSYVSSS